MHKLRLAIPVTIFLLSILGFALIFSPNHSLRPGFSPAQSGIEDFAELDHKGNLFELYRSTKRSGAKALVLISTGIGCPIAENSLAKIQELAQTYNPRKVQFILVNSNTQDSR
ncbi:MAG: hypothetical protein ACXVBE_15335, partial [Bdellovibrionota bacterium]